MSREGALGIVRHALTFIGGILVAKGILEQGLLTEIVGGVITAIGGIWSVISKTKN
jgi:hypothetical protein